MFKNTALYSFGVLWLVDKCAIYPFPFYSFSSFFLVLKMPLNPDEIVALTGTAFVTQIPNIRFRQHGSALGIIKMYQDRFEWHDPALSDPVVVIPYETVSGLLLLLRYMVLPMFIHM